MRYKEGVYNTDTEYKDRFLTAYVCPSNRGVYLLTDVEWIEYADKSEGYWGIGASTKIKEIIIDREMLRWQILSGLTMRIG